MFFFRRTNDIATLQWHMRIASQETLRHYLQEVAHRNILSALPSVVRDKLHKLSNLFDDVFACPALL